MKAISFLACATALIFVGCSSSSTSTPPPDSGTPFDSGSPLPDSGSPAGAFIVITNLAYSPVELTVDAGTLIGITNNDGMEHTVTSEAADNAFTPSAVGGVSFDVTVPAATSGGGGPYGGGGGASPGTASFTIPASAASGTVIPFYCNIHKGTMATPNGHITIR